MTKEEIGGRCVVQIKTLLNPSWAPPSDESYPFYFVDGYTWVFRDPDEKGMDIAWLYCCFDLDGDETFDIEMQGPSPHWKNSIGHEVNESGWESVLGADGSGCPTPLYWMLQKGIAPGQCAWIEVGVEYYICSYEYNEWDVGYFHHVMNVDPWTPEQSLKAWDAYLARGR